MPNQQRRLREPEQFDISDDDVDEETPITIPCYNLTDDMFNVFQGKIDQEEIDALRQLYTKTLKLGRHIHIQPNDSEAKEQYYFEKGYLARTIYRLRIQEDSLDHTCLKLLDTIEKDAHLRIKVRKQLARRMTLIHNKYNDEAE